MTKTHDVWQGLMDAAYETFKDKSYEEFLHDLTVQQREAVLIGNLNYQVENGGIQQWVENGYAVHAPELLIVLAKVGTPLAKEIAERVGAFVEAHVDPSVRKKGSCFDCYWLNDDEEDGGRSADQETFDDWYYEINDAFMTEVEAYFAG